MAQDGEVKVDIRMDADVSGAEKAEKGLDRVRRAARKASSESNGGLERMRAGVGRVSGAFGALRSVLTGFGIGGAVMAITGGLSRIVGSFGAARKSAEEFGAIQRKLGESKAIASLEGDYARLADAIDAAAEAQNHSLEMVDLEVANRRRLAAAKLDAAKENEISRLDPDAPDYAERLDGIERKYAAMKANEAASNAVEDIVLARQRTDAQASQADARADAQDAATKAIDAKIAAAKRAKGASDAEATDLNEHDKTGVLSAVGKTLHQLFTGDWGRMAGAKTAEGDQVRRASAERAAQYELQIQRLEEERRKSEEKADGFRKQAGRLRERAGAMGSAIEAAEIERDTARGSGARGEAAAHGAIERKNATLAAEEAKAKDARRAVELLSAQKAAIEGQIRERQSDKDAAGLAVYRAQGDYDAARLGGGRRAQASALAGLQGAKDMAMDVDRAADGAINALTAALKSVEARLKAAKTYLESQSRQQRNAWAEAPAGD